MFCIETENSVRESKNSIISYIVDFNLLELHMLDTRFVEERTISKIHSAAWIMVDFSKFYG